jgi:hypothetical protein
VLDRLKNYATTANNSLKYEGVSILLWRMLVKLLSPFVELHHQILFEYDLTQPIPERHARIECVIRPATEADLDAIVDGRTPVLPRVDWSGLPDREEYAQASLERDSAEIRENFRRSATRWMRAGETCFIACIGNEVVHSNWIQFDWSRTADEREVALGTGDIYTTEGFTANWCRGKGIHEAVNAAMLRHARDLGYRRAYTITDLVKAGPRRGVIRLGWRRRGHHLFITSDRFRRTWVIPLGGDVEPVLRAIH